VLTVLGASTLALACFLVLPLIQAIHQPPGADLWLRPVDAGEEPPPPPPPEETPPEEEEPEEPPPELLEEAPPLDLSSLELALNPGFGDGWGGGEMALRLGVGGSGEDGDGLVSFEDLDQRPRAIYQPAPVLDADMRRRTPASVHVVFVVDARGRVEDPKVQRSSDPGFERAALAAVRQWRFEPGKRGGEPVRFRMRVPITFPEG
jgi:periplasmic protein TonB